MTLGTMLRLGAAAGAMALGIDLTVLAIFGTEALESYSVVSIELSWVGFISLVSYVLYLNGFAAIGIKYKNKRLTYAAQALILLSVLVVTLYYSSLIIDGFDTDAMHIAVSVINIGIFAAMLVLGWNLLNLKQKLGPLAVWYGCLEIISGISILFYIWPSVGMALNLALFALGTAILYRLNPGEK